MANTLTSRAAPAAIVARLADDRSPRALVIKWSGSIVAFLAVIELAFSPAHELLFKGGALGALYGLLAIGIILVYRTNRIINFAAGGLGALSGLSMVLVQVIKGVPFAVCFPAALVLGAVLGAVLEFGIIRRFSKAPRLILTVATIGLSQLLAFLNLKVRAALGKTESLGTTLPTPWGNWVDIKYTSGVSRATLLDGNEVAVFAFTGLVAVGLSLFFKRTRMGIAVRASAENADRASLLGIPVKLVGTVAWVLASVLAALAIYLRSSLGIIPVDGTLGVSVLIYALAAATIAKMDRLDIALAAGVAVGILEQAVVAATGKSSLATAMGFLVILGALLLQRKSGGRANDVGSLTFQTIREFRPIPAELRSLPEVWMPRAVLGVMVAALALGAPYLVGEAQWGKLTLIPMGAIVAVSLVILTGWAGQISLGHFGLVGCAALVTGGLANRHNVDFFTALIVGIAFGAFVSVLLGIPALRIQGLYLAVITLAFASAVEDFGLRPEYIIFRNLGPDPSGNARIERPLLFDRIDLSNERTFYYLCCSFLLLAILAARSFRKNRSGRVLIAVRDNSRAAPAYGINLARTKLAAFAISGGIASAAGVLYAYQQQSIDHSTYGVVPSIFVFTVAVIGGLSSIAGAVAGSVIFNSIRIFGGTTLSLFASSVGLLVILVVLPGGLAEFAYGLRDRYLRVVAERRGILVPSLVADRRVVAATAGGDDADENDVIAHAGKAAEAIEHPVLGTVVKCPVCHVVLPPEDAPWHEHLRVDEASPPSAGDQLQPLPVA